MSSCLRSVWTSLLFRVASCVEATEGIASSETIRWVCFGFRYNPSYRSETTASNHVHLNDSCDICHLHVFVTGMLLDLYLKLSFFFNTSTFSSAAFGRLTGMLLDLQLELSFFFNVSSAILGRPFVGLLNFFCF